MSELIIYVTTREEIERGDTSRFLLEFGLASLGADPPKWDMGSVMFTVDGYDERDELYLIPEVRAFYRKLHEEWPCWLYYSELMTECLRVVALCIIDTISAQKIENAESAQVALPAYDLHQFAEDSLLTLALLGERAGLSEDLVEERLNAVMHYLGFEKKPEDNHRPGSC